MREFPRTIKDVSIPDLGWQECSSDIALEHRKEGKPLLVMLDESQHAVWSMRPDFDMHCWAYQHGQVFLQDENASYYFLTTAVSDVWTRGKVVSNLHFFIAGGN